MNYAYDAQEIEGRWQARWAEEHAFEVANDDPRPPFYVLCMYPYPSGAAHQGHVRNYTFGDLNVRWRMMQGYSVLSPFGFDSFGLPAENAAIKTGTHPRIFTDARIQELTKSVRRLGAGYDWRRTVRSHDPLYMRFNQVIFLHFLKEGLAYRKKAPVNWCPGCNTVLANEQVRADGTCERSGDLVVKKDLEQWFFRITDFADELLDDLETLEWPERVKTMQRNWIGRSEGAQFQMEVVGSTERIEVFTTRPDTAFGMTFVVLAPEHPLVPVVVTPERPKRSKPSSNASARNPSSSGSRSRVLRTNGEPSPAPTPSTRSTANRSHLPGRLRAHGLRYGRHHGRAGRRPARLGVRPGLRAAHNPHGSAAGGLGRRSVHGRRPPHQQPVAGRDCGHVRGQEQGHRWLEENGTGRRTVQYRLRDWLVSRQRYWGCPIPVIYCPNDGIVPVPEKICPCSCPTTSSSCPRASHLCGTTRVS